jgi:hypothetical protein
VQDVARDERAERVRNNDDLVIAVAVGVPKPGNITESGHVTLEDPSPGWCLHRSVAEISVDVEKMNCWKELGVLLTAE